MNQESELFSSLVERFSKENTLNGVSPVWNPALGKETVLGRYPVKITHVYEFEWGDIIHWLGHDYAHNGHASPIFNHMWVRAGDMEIVNYMKPGHEKDEYGWLRMEIDPFNNDSKKAFL